jgi:hypothetical protein
MNKLSAALIFASAIVLSGCGGSSGGAGTGGSSNVNPSI